MLDASLRITVDDVEPDGKTANIIFDDTLANRTNGAVALGLLP